MLTLLPLQPHAPRLTVQRTPGGAEGVEYAIAHNLRTPLRAVASTASVLLEELGTSLSEGHRSLLERQAVNAVRFGRLLDDLLELSRLERAPINRAPVDVTAITAHFETRVEAEVGMTLDADPCLARLLIECLVDNALKFSRGTVGIRQIGAALAVSDEGPGIDVSHSSRIFEPFERLVGDDVPGTGVGLAKARRIVERHGGEIWIESAPGCGTTVCFTLTP